MSKQMDSAYISSLWKRYKRTESIELRNELIEVYLMIVKYNAERIKARLPDSVDLDDLISVGVFGLIDAIKTFDLSRGVKFETYCVTRIRGAILDEMRLMDWVPRVARQRNKGYEMTRKALGNGSLPTIQEIADYLNVSIEEAEKIERQGNAHTVYFLSIKDAPKGEDKNRLRSQYFVSSNDIPDTKTLKPEDEFLKDANFEELVSFLSNKEQIIITLYFRDNYTMKRIGEILDLSESRVSQMCSIALQKIRDSLSLEKEVL